MFLKFQELFFRIIRKIPGYQSSDLFFFLPSHEEKNINHFYLDNVPNSIPNYEYKKRIYFYSSKGILLNPHSKFIKDFILNINSVFNQSVLNTTDSSLYSFAIFSYSSKILGFPKTHLGYTYRSTDGVSMNLVHGNTESIAFTKLGQFMLGRITLRRSKYRVQKSFREGDRVLLFLTNNTPINQLIKIRIHTKFINKEVFSIKLPVRGSFFYDSKDENINDICYFSLESNMLLCRPIVCIINNDHYDYFHG